MVLYCPNQQSLWWDWGATLRGGEGFRFYRNGCVRSVFLNLFVLASVQLTFCCPALLPYPQPKMDTHSVRSCFSALKSPWQHASRWPSSPAPQQVMAANGKLADSFFPACCIWTAGQSSPGANQSMLLLTWQRTLCTLQK